MDSLIIGALTTGGFFAGSVTMIAMDRISAWKKMPDAQFKEDFAATIRAADRAQPMLLIVTLAMTLGFAITTTGLAQLLSVAAALVQVVSLLASLAALVPLQKQIIAGYREGTVGDEALHSMRSRWYTGHTRRAALSIIMLLLLAATAIAATM